MTNFLLDLLPHDFTLQKGGMAMSGMRLGMALGLILAMLVIAAEAAPLRTAKVGDPMSSLVQGLTEFDAGSFPCAGVPDIFLVKGYSAPGAPQDLDHASVGVTYWQGKIIEAVTFDETDLSVPVMAYADISGSGKVEHIWSFNDDPTRQNVPTPCEVAFSAYLTQQK